MASQSQHDTPHYDKDLTAEFARVYHLPVRRELLLRLAANPLVNPNILIQAISSLRLPLLPKVSLLRDAVSKDRLALVKILLDRDDIDTIFGGHVARDYASTPEMHALFEARQARLTAATLAELAAAIAPRPPEQAASISLSHS